MSPGGSTSSASSGCSPKEASGSRAILGLTLGLDLAPELHPLAACEELQEALVDFLDGLVAERPAVILLEDLHWAEEHLLDVVERLLHDVRGPLMVVATARPELLARRCSRTHYAEAAGERVELRDSALAWLRRAADLAVGRYEIDDGLAPPTRTWRPRSSRPSCSPASPPVDSRARSAASRTSASAGMRRRPAPCSRVADRR